MAPFVNPYQYIFLNSCYEKKLLVDDNTNLLVLLKISLVKHGFPMTTLSNTTVVQQTIDKVQPALVIIDIKMRQYGGQNIYKKLKSHPVYNSLRVVLYSTMVNGSVLKVPVRRISFGKPLTAEILVGHLIKLKRT